jgi:hypothetical protein
MARKAVPQKPLPDPQGNPPYAARQQKICRGGELAEQPESPLRCAYRCAPMPGWSLFDFIH